MVDRPGPARTLILYATPTGPLAVACRDYFEAASRIGPTTAQTYPPHCTLTGFFHRSPTRADEVVAEMGRVVGGAGPVPDGAVVVVGPVRRPDWIGLELSSPWLAKLTARVVADHRLLPGDDALRPKDWLHLSLAYGVDDLDPYASLASSFDGATPGGWEVALWERHPDGTWTRLTR